MTSPGDPHVFLSYVHEDDAEVDELEASLKAAGLNVWRDHDALGPGADWKAKIRSAITGNALAFVGCFSENSEKKVKSGQRDELLLAVEEIRARPLDTEWFIPVRFADVDLPNYDVGGGRSLRSFQYTDIFGAKKATGTMKVATAIRDMFHKAGTPTAAAAPTPVSSTPELRSILADPTKSPAVSSLVDATTVSVRREMENATTFPYGLDNPDGGNTAWAHEIVRQFEQYCEIAKPAVEAIIAGCEWGRDTELKVWTRVVSRLAKPVDRPSQPGSLQTQINVALQSLGRTPALLSMYAGTIAALREDRFAAIEAITLAPKLSSYRRYSGLPKRPALTTLDPWNVFDGSTATLLRANQRQPDLLDDPDKLRHLFQQGIKGPTASLVLFTALRDFFPLWDEDEYAELFDTAEVYFSLLIADLARQDSQYEQPWFGRFTWDRDSQVYKNLREECAAANPDSWPPTKAGLFGGSHKRMVEAFSALDPDVEKVEREYRFARY